MTSIESDRRSFLVAGTAFSLGTVLTSAAMSVSTIFDGPVITLFDGHGELV